MSSSRKPQRFQAYATNPTDFREQAGIRLGVRESCQRGVSSGNTFDGPLIGGQGPDSLHCISGNDLLSRGADDDLIQAADGVDQLCSAAARICASAKVVPQWLIYWSTKRTDVHRCTDQKRLRKVRFFGRFRSSGRDFMAAALRVVQGTEAISLLSDPA